MTDAWTIVIAAYAAIVATGALFLEVRRWFESGPRLVISVVPEAETVDAPDTEGKTYLFGAVANRGNAPTTITHFVLYDYGSWLGRLRGKPRWVAAVKSGPHTSIPATLAPGQMWTGIVPHDEGLKDRILAGQLYVAVYASHSDEPTMKRVRMSAKPSEEVEKIYYTPEAGST